MTLNHKMKKLKSYEKKISPTSNLLFVGLIFFIKFFIEIRLFPPKQYNIPLQGETNI